MKRMQIVCGCLSEGDSVRELSEELSIQAKVLEKLCVIEDNTKDIPLTVTAYACQILAGEPVCKVHSQGQWIVPNAIDLSTFHASDEPIIKALTHYMSR